MDADASRKALFLNENPGERKASSGVRLKLGVSIERFPIAGGFTISRGSKTEAVVVAASIEDGTHTGRGECAPYARYGETVEGVAAAIEACAGAVAEGLTRAALQSLLPAGAARNALDCALWDFEAKRSGRRAALPYRAVTRVSSASTFSAGISTRRVLRVSLTSTSSVFIRVLVGTL